ncbi:MAG: 50S ribosomal protein L10 [Candidatus Micrarchaeia archaeon]
MEALKSSAEREKKQERRSITLKKSAVAELSKEIGKASLIGLVDIRNLPDSQFQRIKKSFRGEVKFKVFKNTIIERALKKSGKAQELAEKMLGPTAILLSDMDPFELFNKIKSSKGRAFLKPGQTAPFDIVVPAGETSIPPGPAMTELKQVGINVKLDKGKVVIATDSVVAKKGEKVPLGVAKALQTLGIKPLEIGMSIIALWQDGFLYTPDILDVDPAKTLADIKTAVMNAFNLSINCDYPTKDNAGLFIAIAYNNARNLAINANIYEKEVIDAILARAAMHANAINSRIGGREEK